MPRRKNVVKTKHVRSTASRKGISIRAIGAVDLHFHGAFGIDLMKAEASELDGLAERLGERGVAAFCPTTLSVDATTLKATAARLGDWIRGFSRSRLPRAAVPLGLHLEGPFISSQACGAHPPGNLRKLTLAELDLLWKASRETLRILTVAPETLSPGELRRLVGWAKPRRVHLSLGHSHASEADAGQAFDLGLKGVTHAWNALNFHQRSPGVLGAALGRNDVFVELIVDGAHVAPTVIAWTRALHPADRLCFVSDCVPAAATPADGNSYSFGPLKIRFADGACRLPDGSLAGGGLLLPDSFGKWIATESSRTGQPAARLLRECLGHVTDAPLAALGVRPSTVGGARFTWKLGPDGTLEVRQT